MVSLHLLGLVLISASLHHHGLALMATSLHHRGVTLWTASLLPLDPAIWCAVSLGAVLRRLAPPCVVLLSAVLFCFARLMPLLAVSCPRALPVALGSCAYRRCVLWCFPALCALCCVCVALVWWCVLLFAAVLCAVVVPGCLAVRSLSSPLSKVLCCAVLVRLRCAVRVVCTVCVLPWCGGACCCSLLCCAGGPRRSVHNPQDRIIRGKVARRPWQDRPGRIKQEEPPPPGQVRKQHKGQRHG